MAIRGIFVMFARSSIVLAVLLVLAARPADAQGLKVDLELVLAIDSSDSVDGGEFALQVKGLADAFRQADIHHAILGLPRRSIAVTVVEWASVNQQVIQLPWTVIDSPEAAVQVADRISAINRSFERGLTSISALIDAAARMFDDNGFDGDRRVVDISSDGRQNDGRPIELSRAFALLERITINALTILTDYEHLDRYYRESVIGGSGAFVEVTNDFSSYPKAIHRKLMREISDVPIS